MACIDIAPLQTTAVLLRRKGPAVAESVLAELAQVAGVLVITCTMILCGESLTLQGFLAAGVPEGGGAAGGVEAADSADGHAAAAGPGAARARPHRPRAAGARPRRTGEQRLYFLWLLCGCCQIWLSCICVPVAVDYLNWVLK